MRRTHRTMKRNKKFSIKVKSIMALTLLVPAPSLGVLAGMYLLPSSPLGKAIFTVCKIWLLVFPLLWLKIVDKGHFSLSPVRQGGLWGGAISGVVLSLLIVLLYLIWGRNLLDSELFISKMQEIGMDSFPMYFGGALYWIFVNSVLEESVWRWFVYEKCEAVTGPWGAIILGSIFFTMHHFIALQTFFHLHIALICSAGVFIGGALWSFMYRRYRSVWPGYISHAVVDLAIFGIGAVIMRLGTIING